MDPTRMARSIALRGIGGAIRVLEIERMLSNQLGHKIRLQGRETI